MPFLHETLVRGIFKQTNKRCRGKYLDIGSRKVKVAFSDNVWQKSQNPEQQQPSLFVRKKTGGRN